MTATLLSKYWDLTDEQVELIKTAIARHATDDELALFVQTCKRMRLDPFARQIFLVKRYDSELKRNVATTQVSVDGYRLVAERTGEYRGQTMPEWCGKDGVWKQVWLENEPPVAARCGVYREGFREPLYRTALFKSYAQYAKDQQGKWYLTNMWKRYPEQMLHKCAESLALRAAFPNELSGVYTLEELPAEEARVDGTEKKAAPEKAAVVREAPRLTVVGDGTPRTLQDFLAAAPKQRAPLTVAAVVAQPEPKAVIVESQTVYDADTGEVQEEWPVPEEEPVARVETKPEVEAKPEPKADQKPFKRVAMQRPDGSCPVWTSGDHRGKPYTETPRAYLKACVDGPWGKNATTRQLAWAKYAIWERTQKAHAEGRE